MSDPAAAPWRPLATDFGDVAALLLLDRVADDVFRNRSHQVNPIRGIFGGQVLGQALAAARMTVDVFRPHSLHAHFLRPGRGDMPIDYRVDRRLDGRSFAVRRIAAVQAGVPILDASCSFHGDECGHDHHSPAPDVPPPAALPSLHEVVRAAADRVSPWLTAIHGRPMVVEVRPIDPDDSVLRGGSSAPRRAWIRLPAAPAGYCDVAAMLAFVSDYWLIPTALAPHAVPVPSPATQMISLNHAMWFHRPAAPGEWILYDCDSPSAQAGRGLARGSMYDERGALVASVVQEGLIRLL